MKALPSRLTSFILLSMLGGILCGIGINLVFDWAWVHTYFVEGLFQLGGKLFLSSLKMIVVPLVFVSIICGTASLKDATQLGRLGLKTLGLYFLTTIAAISIALCISYLIQPGIHFNLQETMTSSEAVYKAPKPPSILQTLSQLIPSNPFQSLASGHMIQIIIFALILGFAITLSGEKGEKVARFFENFNEVVGKMIFMVLYLAPVGVFCLVAKTFAQQGFKAFAPLFWYFLCVILALAVQFAVVYPLLLKSLSGLNPLTMIRKFKSVLLFSFSTSSSNATIPIHIETLTEKLGVRKSVSSFIIPLGATINMDGTAIMQGVATLFIAQAYNIDIGLSGMLMVIFTATLASIGTAGVPSAGLITLALVLKQVQLPTEGIALILGIDRLLDMLRTSVNTTGDAVVTCIVSASENKIDREKFNS